ACPRLEVLGVASVIGTVRAFEDVGPEAHAFAPVAGRPSTGSGRTEDENGPPDRRSVSPELVEERVSETCITPISPAAPLLPRFRLPACSCPSRSPRRACRARRGW